MKYWQTSRRKISLDRPLVMGILNVTPDSFSDGGRFLFVDDAIRQGERMISQGADIIDIGGESTRPGSHRITFDDEVNRTAPVVRGLLSLFDTPISIDTTKSEVAQAAVDAGAEIINDISGLRFDERIADVAAGSGAGLVLMHSRGEFETMHSQPALDDIFSVVAADFRRSINAALSRGVTDEHIALDIGIGFGKTLDQNLELLAKLDNIVSEFQGYPLLVGASRKSFISKAFGGDVPASERLGGSLAAALIAVRSGAQIIRVHDVKETVQALRLASVITERSDPASS